MIWLMDYEAGSDNSGYVEQYCRLPWIRSYFNFINIFLFRNNLKFSNNGESIANCDKLNSKDSDVRINFAVCFHSEFVSHALHPCILKFCLLDIITSKISLSHGKVQETVHCHSLSGSPSSLAAVDTGTALSIQELSPRCQTPQCYAMFNLDMAYFLFIDIHHVLK